MTTTQINGVSVHYEAPRGLPIHGNSQIALFVHGFGGSSRQYRELIPYLSPEIAPVVLDLPGHGFSDGVLPSSEEAAVGVLHGLLSNLQIPLPVLYVGHSFGGLIGLLFALADQARLAGLVLIAAAARFRLHPNFLRQSANGAWNREELRQGFSRDLAHGLQELILDDLFQLRLGPGGIDANWGDINLAPRLGEISVPALCVAPEDDVILSPRNSRELARGMAAARLVRIAQAGHYVHIEKPEDVARQINSFARERLAQ